MSAENFYTYVLVAVVVFFFFMGFNSGIKR